MTTPANLITTLLYSPLIIAQPRYTVTGDPAYVAAPSYAGWITANTDYTGTTGQAAFQYKSLSNSANIQNYKTGARTSYLPYAANTKYYMEIALTALLAAARYWMLGIAADSTMATNYTASPGVYALSGAGYGGAMSIAGGGFVAGDVLMIAYDTSTNQVFFGKNGVWSVNPVSGTGAVIPGVSTAARPRLVFMKTASAYAAEALGVFKSSAGFSYPAPAGYVSLNGSVVV